MKKLKNISAAVVAFSLLTACTTTSTNLKSTGKSGAPSTSSIAVKSVDDVYLSVVSEHKFDANLPIFYTDSLSDNQKFVVEMQSNFGRKFKLCEDGASCQQVVPASAREQSNEIRALGDPDQVYTNIIAEVKLSDKVNSLFGKKIGSSVSDKKILIMRPDVELSTLTAGGLKEPNALWTSSATNYVTEISAQYLEKLGYDVALYKDDANDVSEKTGQDLINLHEAVGISVLLYQQNPMLRLPTLEGGKFDWQMGKTTKVLKKAYGAKYGLFIYLRDAYSSGSRVATQILMAVLFGTQIQGGQQIGFASLVDLETGEIEWFNRIHSTSGDLRTFDASLNATDILFKDIPL